MHRWLSARCKAFELRRDVELAYGRELYGEDLLLAIIAQHPALELIRVVHNDPLLGGLHGSYCQAKYILDEGIILVNKDASPQDFNLYLAHELGHHFLHTRPDICNSADVNPERLVFTLPYAEGRIATYNSYQAQENEANVFASELLMPSARVADKFDSGANADTLAEFFHVSRYSILSQMASVLLEPSIDFESFLTTQTESVFHWHNLDESQLEAACIPEGPVQVDAGPGTGKTRTLTSRVEWLIEENHTAPETILILTFSNKASGELYDRLKKIIPDHVHQVMVTTFHGFGLELLRRYSHLIDLAPDFTVLDPVEAELLLTQNLDALNLSHFSDPVFPDKYLVSSSFHGTMLDFISQLKQEIITPVQFEMYINQIASSLENEDAEKYREIAHVYHVYERIKRSAGLVDYDDLIMLPVLILSDNKPELEQLQTQYQHILVDEYQDINRANGELIKLLTSQNNRGLWVVGDLRQSIYRWRGASPLYLRDFQTQYSSAKVKQLDINYRASQQVVDYLNGFIKGMNATLGSSDWKSARGKVDNSQIRVIEAANQNDEIQGIIDTIRLLVSKGDYSYKDFAVLCRRKVDGNHFAECLSMAGIPVLHFGNFFERVEIRDLLSVVDVTTDFQGVSWIRLAQILEYPLTRLQAVDLWQQIYSQKIAFPLALKTISEISTLDTQRRNEILQLAEIFLKYQHAPLANPWLILADFLFEYGQYLRKLRSNLSENVSKLLAIGQLLNLAKSFSQRPLNSVTGSRGEAFLEHIRSLMARADGDIVMPSVHEAVDAVHILTIHKAKGLEFPIVFVPGLAKGVFPPSGGTRPIMPVPDGLLQNLEPNGQQLEEENCLFVAVSRARDTVVISRPKRRNNRNSNPSDLWELLASNIGAIENWEQFDDIGIPKQDWHESLPNEVLQNLNVSALRIAEYCPRQFYYRYGLDLRAINKRELYAQFHGIVIGVIQWVQKALHDGQKVEWSAIQSYFDELFEAAVSNEHVHKNWYKKHGLQQLSNYWAQLESRFAQGKNIFQFRVAVTIDKAVIDVEIDETIETQAGYHALHYRIGKKKKNSDIRLSLYRQALISAGYEGQLEVYTHSLSDNEIYASVAQDEQKVMQQLGKQLEGIVEGNFPPSPQYENTTCAKCRFLFICPT